MFLATDYLTQETRKTADPIKLLLLFFLTEQQITQTCSWISITLRSQLSQGESTWFNRGLLNHPTGIWKLEWGESTIGESTLLKAVGSRLHHLGRAPWPLATYTCTLRIKFDHQMLDHLNFFKTSYNIACPISSKNVPKMNKLIFKVSTQFTLTNGMPSKSTWCCYPILLASLTEFKIFRHAKDKIFF